MNEQDSDCWDEWFDGLARDLKQIKTDTRTILPVGETKAMPEIAPRAAFVPNWNPWGNGGER